MDRLIKAYFASMAAFRFGWKHEAALRQEMIVFAAAVPLALWLTSNPWKILALWGSLLVLLAVEFLNTGIEKLADRVTTDHDELIKVAKDCGSAAVLVVSMLAGALWLLAIGEKLFG